MPVQTAKKTAIKTAKTRIPTMKILFYKKPRETATRSRMKGMSWLMVGLKKGQPPAMYPDVEVTA